MTGPQPDTLRSMIEFTKKVETGYGSLMSISDAESTMREDRIEKTKTVCTYCGVGCSFDIRTKGREILKVQPQTESPANGMATCVKGKFGWDYVNSEERLTKPLIREGDHFREAEWEEGIPYVAHRFQEIKEQDGSDALGFIALLYQLSSKVFQCNIKSCHPNIAYSSIKTDSFNNLTNISG